MQVQPQLVLLQKTLLYVEGLGRQLYPELDLWETAQPYLKKWLREQIGPKAIFEEVKTQFPDWLHKAPKIPGLLFDNVHRLGQELEKFDSLKQELTQLEQYKIRQNAAQKHAILGIGFALLSGLLYLGIPYDWWPALGAAAISGLFLVRSLWPIKTN